MRLLLLDNYDSFTYNLYQYLLEVTSADVDVRRNDQIELQEIMPYDGVVISPGPGLPRDAGITLDLIRQYAGQKPILGVCLGHQAIGEAFGAKLKNLKQVYHGIETPIHFTNTPCSSFEGLPGTIRVGRYHSWVIERDSVPECLHITAVDDQGEIMSIQHESYPLVGLQFHPESIMTPQGKEILHNFCQSLLI